MDLNKIIGQCLFYITLFYIFTFAFSIAPVRGVVFCELLHVQDEDKLGNISDPVDRQISFGILSDHSCYFSTFDLYKTLYSSAENDSLTDPEKENYMVLLRFSCLVPVPLYFTDLDPTEGDTGMNIRLGLIFTKCTISLDNLAVFQIMGKIAMLNMVENSVHLQNMSICEFVTDVRSIYVQPDCSSYHYHRTSDFFWNKCTRQFAHVEILKIKGCIESRYTLVNFTELPAVFPNLEALVLQIVSVSGDVYFPWKTSSVPDAHYTDAFKAFFLTMKDIYVENLFYEKSLILDYCVLDSNIYLVQKLEMFVLTESTTEYLDPHLFQNVLIYYTINLSLNKMKLLHPMLFRGQYHVEYLYLHGNNLTHLPTGIFSDLTRLKYISLFRNKLQTIESDLFAYLFNLEEVYLHENQIRVLPDEMFKHQIHSLKYLSLKQNPLARIPVWPLYSTTLETMDMRYCNLTGESVVNMLPYVSKLKIAEKEVEMQMNIKTIARSSGPGIGFDNNKIATIPSEQMNLDLYVKLDLFLKYFVVSFVGNPFECNCDTTVIKYLFNNNHNNETGYSLIGTSLYGMVCQYPKEFRGRSVWDIEENEQYCPANVTQCPTGCKCMKRKHLEVIIVDCRDTVLQGMPGSLPKGSLELWFENSNISEIGNLTYLKNITVLNLSGNKLTTLPPSIVNQFVSLKSLRLDGNHLTTLPYQIRSRTKLQDLRLSNNPFACNCHTRWMKTWLLEDENIVRDWTSIKCLDTNDKLHQLVAVPDELFVCKSNSDSSVTEHIVFPSILLGSILLVILIIFILGYTFRFNLKVLLFIHFNLHPFDKDKEISATDKYDAFLFFEKDDTEVKETISEYLSAKGYRLADLYRDSLIGYTYLTNTERLIKRSNRIIIIIPDNTTDDSLLPAVWSIAYADAANSTLQKIILLSGKSASKETSVDDSLLQFMKSGQFIQRDAPLMLAKLEYLMPRVKTRYPGDNEMTTIMVDADSAISLDHSSMADPEESVLLCYPYDIHEYVKENIWPVFSQCRLSVKILEMEFTPGADMRDEIPNILSNSRHVFFIISQETLLDDVISFMLTQALTKTQLENYNYLLLCTSGPVDVGYMSNDLVKYVQKYVTISLLDKHFKQRIKASILSSRGRPQDPTGSETELLLQEDFET